nr:uncharacterized protein LOC107280071 isoform X1 [Oryza sativa Japonica Group]
MLYKPIIVSFGSKKYIFTLHISNTQPQNPGSTPAQCTRAAFPCSLPVDPPSAPFLAVDEAPVTEEEPPTVSIIDVMPTNCALLFGSRKHLPKRKGNGCGL